MNYKIGDKIKVKKVHNKHGFFKKELVTKTIIAIDNELVAYKYRNGKMWVNPSL